MGKFGKIREIFAFHEHKLSRKSHIKSRESKT